MSQNNELLTAALTYAARGWKVFPLRPRSKLPLTEHGFKDGTTNPSLIRKWWSDTPAANIGLWLEGSGLVAIDIDPRNGGVETVEDLVAFNGTPPPTFSQASGRGDGGQHGVYRAPGFPIVSSLGPGVDVKHKGYIVLAPSIHPDSGKPYKVDHDDAPAELGPIWSELVRREDLAATTTPECELTPDQVSAVESALGAIQHPDRDTWLRVGAALHASGFDQSTWDDWASSNGAPFNQADQNKTWAGFRADRQGGASYRTVLKLAQNAGWQNPNAGHTPMAFDKWTDPDPEAQGPPTKQPDAPQRGTVIAGSGSESAEPTTPPGQDRKRLRHSNVVEDKDFDLDTPYTIKGVLPRHGIGVIYGRPGCGKTFAALGMANAVTNGQLWHGHRTHGDPVAILAAENPASIKRRLQLMGRAGHLGPNPIHVFRADLANVDLRSAELVNELVAELRELKVRFVIVDTLATATPGMEENSAKDMGEVVAAAQAIARAVNGFCLLVHHSGKDESKGGRGSSALLGGIDVELHVQKEQGCNTLFIEGMKARDGELLERSWFQLETWEAGTDSDGDVVRGARLVEIEPPDAGDPGRDQDEDPAKVFAPPMPTGRNQVEVLRAVDELSRPVEDDPAIPVGHLAAKIEDVTKLAATRMVWVQAIGRHSEAATRERAARKALGNVLTGGTQYLFRTDKHVGRIGQ